MSGFFWRISLILVLLVSLISLATGCSEETTSENTTVAASTDVTPAPITFEPHPYLDIVDAIVAIQPKDGIPSWAQL